VELDPEVTGDAAPTVSIDDLALGMILDQEIRTEKGVLVAAKGQEVTSLLLLKLKSFLAKGTIPPQVAAIQPNVQ